MNVVQLRQLKAQKLDQAEALAKIEDRALEDNERDQIDMLLAEADKLEADAVRLEKIEGFRGVSKPEGFGMPVHIQRPTADNANSIFCRYVRSGDQGAQRELNSAVMAEYRASNDTTMNITTAGDGGDLVPTGHYQGIIEKARPVDLTSQLGLINIPGRGTSVNVPVDNETDDGQFVSTGESTAFDRDAPAVTKVTMTLVKYTKKVDLTYELLADEDSRLMDFLNSYVGKGYAATLNALMVAEALADGTAGLTLDSATAIGAAEIPELLYKLKAQYASGSNVAWLMERATEGYLRGLTSSSVFTFGQVPGEMGRATLFGVPLYTDENMGTKQASGKSLLVANWGFMGKRIDPTMTFLRDPFTRSSYGEIILNYYFRADFEVLQAEAFQYATHPTG